MIINDLEEVEFIPLLLLNNLVLQSPNNIVLKFNLCNKEQILSVLYVVIFVSLCVHGEEYVYSVESP